MISDNHNARLGSGFHVFQSLRLRCLVTVESKAITLRLSSSLSFTAGTAATASAVVSSWIESPGEVATCCARAAPNHANKANNMTK